MSWQLYRWVWRLEEPLVIGMPPAGSLNRCRLYVPARTLWGALTETLACCRRNDEFPDYKGVGKKLQDECRFTYLYPAEKEGEDYRVWLPFFEEGKGLVWKKGDEDEVQPERDFRRRLVWTQASTAVDASTDTADDSTLRETEYINLWWSRDSRKADPSPVFMVGYVWVKDDGKALLEDLGGIEEIRMGGEKRYGFGRMRRIAFERIAFDSAPSCFDLQFKEENGAVLVEGKRVLAHAFVEGKRDQDDQMMGDYELVMYWKREAKDAEKKEHASLGRSDCGQDCEGVTWVPGSKSEKPWTWQICPDGLWRLFSS